MGNRGEVYTKKMEVASGKRSYFFNVKVNRKGDHFLNIVESINKLGDTYNRQEILVYQEHLDEFRLNLDEAIYQMKMLSSEDNDFPKLHSLDPNTN